MMKWMGQHLASRNGESEDTTRGNCCWRAYPASVVTAFSSARHETATTRAQPGISGNSFNQTAKLGMR